MIKPISKGDLCIVIDGVLEQRSPNIGKIVRVVSAQGEHSKYGIIWRCQGAELVSHETANTVNTADFAQSWLRKIEPPVSFKSTTKELEKEHV